MGRAPSGPRALPSPPSRALTQAHAGGALGSCTRQHLPAGPPPGITPSSSECPQHLSWGMQASPLVLGSSVSVPLAFAEGRPPADGLLVMAR